MHQTSTGTKKTQFPATTRKWTHRSWIQVFFVFLGACAGLVHLLVLFCWCLCRFCDSDFTKHWQAPIKKNKTKPLDAPNIGRHQKKINVQQLLRNGPIGPGYFLVFACAGLVALTSQNIDRQQQEKKTLDALRCTKHRQAPNKKKKIQQLLRSGPIVPVFFCVFFVLLVPVQVWWLCFTKHWQAAKITRNTANISSNLLSLLLHLLLISPWWISIAAASFKSG